MLKKIRELFSQKGQGIVEYVLLIGFVTLIVVVVYSDTNFTGTFKGALHNVLLKFQ